MKRKPMSKVEVEERNRPVFCLLSFVLASFILLGCSRAPIERVEWPAMGTIAAVQTKGGGLSSEALDAVKAEFNRVNEHFNIHDPKAPIHEIAKCTDESIMSYDAVFPWFCYSTAFNLRDASEGAFNPRWRGPGTLDMGAIAKGFAVDLAADAVKACYGKADGNMPEMLIDLGGNLKAVKGDWTVGIKDGESFVLREGEACATSARYYRGDHIKDGRTGADVKNDVYSVTVIHPKSAMLADGLSTTLFILGREKGEEFLKKHYSDARAFWLHAGL